jgi:hypothetical protein
MFIFISRFQRTPTGQQMIMLRLHVIQKDTVALPTPKFRQIVFLTLGQSAFFDENGFVLNSKPYAFKSTMTKKLLFLKLCLFLLLPAWSAQAARIAVFDPEVNTKGRFQMSVEEMNAVAASLRQVGMEVSRVTTKQIDDPKAFGADQFDVLVMRGDAVPRVNFPAIKKFAEGKGVVVAFSAKTPFSTAVTGPEAGNWVLSPAAPQFAWQTSELSDVFGVRYTYRAAMLNSGLQHTATPLFKKYLPAATDIKGVLPSTWVHPVAGGEFYPLVRSLRGDGLDVTPQVFIARKGEQTAVMATADFWTKGDASWKFGKETLIGLVKIAADLRSGALTLTAADKIDLPADLAPAAPLTSRVVSGEVDPDNAPVVTRWGRFDGSSLDLRAEAGKPASALPQVLKPGVEVTLPLRQNGKPLWLRVRGAVAQSGATLKVVANERTLWHEAIPYAEVGEVGNFGTLNLGNAPIEFTRRVFVPPTEAQTLVLTNTGIQPVYFDAAQIENDPVKPVTWLTGMGSGWNQLTRKGSTNLPTALAKEWTAVRGSMWAQDVGPPGDPKRWDVVEQRLQGYLSTGAPLEVLIEGTPKYAAISPERYAAADRKRAVPPDPQKYKDIVEYLLKQHGDKISTYEIWNEQDSQHYWLGKVEEYIAFWRMAVPMIRELDPSARVMIGGLTGFDHRFLEELIRNGVIKEADLLAFHPYAGAEAAWDKPFGNIQGQLYSMGQNIEIYNNEVGFPVERTFGFTDAKFPYTVTTQSRMTNVAIARLLANAVAKFSIFHAGGDDHPFAHIDPNGKPRPAYHVLQDYFRLGQNDGRRLDVSMSRADGGAQTGVYLAGSQHADGAVTVVINPAEVQPLRYDAPDDAVVPPISVPLILRVPLSQQGAWKAALDGQQVPVTVLGKSGQSWAELRIDLKKRSVLTLRLAPSQ